MPSHLRRHALQQFLQHVDPAGGGGTPPAAPTETPKPEETPLGEPGKKALDDEREARRLSDKRAKDAEQKLADIEAARVKAEEATAKVQGEWKELAEKREASLTEATTNLESATAELTTLREYVNADIKSAIKDLPKALLAFDPGEEASLAQRLDWLTKAKANAAEIANSVEPGNGPGPKPAGNGKLEIPSAVPKRSLFS